MSQEDNNPPGTADETTLTTVKKEEEETIPILELTVTSNHGATPCDMAGSLKIPMEDSADLLPDTPPVCIVERAGLPIRPKWHVFVTLRTDRLPKATVIKGKVCQEYVRINALICFHKEYEIEIIEIDESKHVHIIESVPLQSGEFNGGEWLLPVNIPRVAKDGSGTREVLLAYVRVKIEDQPVTPATGGTPEKPKPASDTQEQPKKGSGSQS